jgi:hypothetical protein
MNSYLPIVAWLVGANLSTLAHSQTTPPAHGEHEAPPNIDWVTGEGCSLGGVLTPSFHFNSEYGWSSGELDRLALGHHDPKREDWNLGKGIEAGLSARVGEYLEAFGNAIFPYDIDEREWKPAMEEWFGKIKNIPGGFELRGGRYYNRFGLQNTYHPHGWDYVDQSLVNARFLSDDSLTTTGGEITWIPFETVQWSSLISVSIGEARTEEAGHDEHGEELEAEFEAEGTLFASTLTVANWTNSYALNDFHQVRFGASGAWGENGYERSTQAYGAHVEYQWRQNGFDSGGRYFRWRTELMVRHFGAVSGHLPGESEEEIAAEEESNDEHAEEKETVRRRTFAEFGGYTSFVYGVPTGFAGPLELALRADYVEGVAEAGLDERFRLSPGVRLFVNESRTAYVGAQYNFDHSNVRGLDNSFWLSFGFNWGLDEVR